MSETDRNPAAGRKEPYQATAIARDEHTEATVTRLIEQQTAKLPSHWFLLAAFGSMGLSLGLEVAGRRQWSRFVGMWTAPLLITGVYNKLVKALGTQ